MEYPKVAMRIDFPLTIDEIEKSLDKKEIEEAEELGDFLRGKRYTSLSRLVKNLPRNFKELESVGGWYELAGLSFGKIVPKLKRTSSKLPVTTIFPITLVGEVRFEKSDAIDLMHPKNFQQEHVYELVISPLTRPGSRIEKVILYKDKLKVDFSKSFGLSIGRKSPSISGRYGFEYIENNMGLVLRADNQSSL